MQSGRAAQGRGLYYFFESKQALALAAIDEQWARQGRQWTCLLEGDAEPLERLRQLFGHRGHAMRRPAEVWGTVSGGSLGNRTLEPSNQTEPIRVRLPEILGAQVDLGFKVIEEAQTHGTETLAYSREAARCFVARLEGQVCSPSSTTRPDTSTHSG
jgi:TetR/AcrR family transcriptional repressor of nem operon